MYSIDFAGNVAPHDVWNWYAARRALREARDGLEEVGQQLNALIAENEWASEGMRALNKLMQQISDDAMNEAEQVRMHLDDLARMQVS